ALGQLVEPAYFQRQPQRVPSGQDVTDRSHLDTLGVVDNVLIEGRQATDFEPFAMQMMLRKAYRVEAQVFRLLRDFDHFLDHALPSLGSIPDRAQRLPLLHRRGEGGQKEIHELHGGLRNSGLLSAKLVNSPTESYPADTIHGLVSGH